MTIQKKEFTMTYTAQYISRGNLLTVTVEANDQFSARQKADIEFEKKYRIRPQANSSGAVFHKFL